MRIIDVAIPHFGQSPPKKDGHGKQLISNRGASEGFFTTVDNPEYLVEEEDLPAVPGSPGERSTSSYVRCTIFNAIFLTSAISGALESADVRTSI